MGKQINYYMGFNDFLTVAQTALDNGCIIYKKVFENGHWKIYSETTIDIVTEDYNRNYYFHLPQTGEVLIEKKNDSEQFSCLSELYLIEAGYSIPNYEKSYITRNRLYVTTGVYDNNGEWIARPDSVTEFYNKLVRVVKKIAPFTEFNHYVVNPLYEGKSVNRKEYISPYCLALVESKSLKLG